MATALLVVFLVRRTVPDKPDRNDITKTTPTIPPQA